MVGEHGLPTPAAPLIGRVAEIAAVVAAATAPGSRLLTLTGPPGVGKSRLALAAAGMVSFPGGTVWVDLAPVGEARLLTTEIVRALDRSKPTVAPPLERPRSAVADTLLVLDNCEHLLDAAPELAELLESTPGVRVLATSRERFRLAAEREFVVPPLPMPSDPDVANLQRLAANPAVALLLARSPGHIALSARTARGLADICVRLDGLPLAIELAAARLRVFTPSELAFRLEHRTAGLTTNTRDVPPRHRDLRAAIAWSHDLLPDAEKAVYRRLSVFVGDWDLAAAEAVCDADVVAAIASLLDKSLIRRVEDDGSGARFGMLMSLREFAREQLELCDDVEPARSRHARYFVGVARDWESTVGTAEENATWSRLSLVRGDLRAAFDRLRSGSELDATLWLAAGLGWCSYTRGSLADAADLLDAVSAAVDTGGASPDAAAAALVAVGVVAFGLGDLDSAERDLLRSTTMSEQRGDERRVAIASAFLGHVARGRGRFDEAAGRYARALSIFETLGNPRGRAWAAHDLGLLASERGDLAAAESLLREALRLFRTLDYEWAVAVSAAALGTVLLRAGTVDQAAQLLGEALALHDEVGDRRGLAQCLEGLAEVALTRGAAAAAARLLGAATAQRAAAATRPAEAEQARLSALDRAMVGKLGHHDADHELHAGRTMPAAAALALAQGIASPDHDDPGIELTARQLEVAALVAASNTNRQIGRALGISEKTAEIHVRNIMGRLHTSSRAGVAAWAAARGLRPPP